MTELVEIVANEKWCNAQKQRDRLPNNTSIWQQPAQCSYYQHYYKPEPITTIHY